MKTKLTAPLIGLILATGQAHAATFTENFEAPFPAWESGWLGTNSNLKNYYGAGEGRGNNPDGLWLSDGVNGDFVANITFAPTFGNQITTFSVDVTTWVEGAVFEAFDMLGNTLISTTITSLYGAYADPGTYQTIAFASTKGVSGFRITGGTIEGNTSIDNVSVNSPVPEPTSLALLAVGLVAAVGFSRRSNRA